MELKTAILITSIPLISALIGWFTNYIAIKSLFKPIKQKKILFLKFHGLIPKRQKELAKNIAEVVEEYLFSHKDIITELEKPQNIKKIKNKILPILENRIIEKIPEMFKIIATPIVKKVLEKEIDSLILQLNEEIANHALESINVKRIITQKLENYDVSNIEEIINKIASKELKHIEYLGAIIGFVVGLVQIIIIYILG